MNETADMFPDETVLWSAIVNGQYVRLVIEGGGSIWRCDCDQVAQSRPDNPPSCEHIRFGFDTWFGRSTPNEVAITDVVAHPKRR
jgi:hypothetical protein